MLGKVQSGSIPIGETSMDYVTFGRGYKPLIIIPGLGDGLGTVKGKGLFMSNYFKDFAKAYKVYVFSRKNALPKSYSTREMARDQMEIMDKLQINDADVIGISQGGMIVQHLAIDYPEKVNKLVIAVSASKPNETLCRTVSQWICLAKANDYKNLVMDTMEKTYTDHYLKKIQIFYPIIKRIGKPKSFDRFITQAYSCLNHQANDQLHKIQCPVFILGGDEDKVVGPHSSKEIADKIKNSQLLICKGLGHSAFEEYKEFNKEVLNFLYKHA